MFTRTGTCAPIIGLFSSNHGPTTDQPRVVSTLRVITVQPRSNHGPTTDQSRVVSHCVLSRSNHGPITDQSRVVSTVGVYLGTAHSRQLPEHPGQQGPVAQQRRGYESPVPEQTVPESTDRSSVGSQSCLHRGYNNSRYSSRRTADGGFIISATSGPLYEHSTCRTKLSYS